MKLEVSAKWAVQVIDCTLEGIIKRCHGTCCSSKSFWPPKASGGTCKNLGPQGCVLGDEKPIECLLYPFRIQGDKLNVHGRALISHCRPNHKVGGQSIAEANRANLALVFGEAQADAIVRAAKDGQNIKIDLPQWVADALAVEARWEEANAIPLARAAMAAQSPPAAPARPEHGSLAELRG
jgi:Fe-S-cluster containining protein